tara:strand:+ start:419 stop:637 length:219 start_codon:yes stop_codon:yes gene_type:complete
MQYIFEEGGEGNARSCLQIAFKKSTVQQEEGNRKNQPIVGFKQISLIGKRFNDRSLKNQHRRCQNNEPYQRD